MNFHWQNLKEDRPSSWLHGRCWLTRSYDYSKRFRGVDVEWCMPPGSCGWGVTFGSGDSGRGLTFRFTIPLLIALYVTIQGAFAKSFREWTFDEGADRQVEVYFFENAIWWHFWVGSMASWSRAYPWCRWWRQGSFHFADLLGKQRCTTTLIEEGIPVAIPMPEGVYHGLAKIERREWVRRFRPRLFDFESTDVWIDVPRGIPHAGKGENSWDCGDDAVCGTGATWAPGMTREAAIQAAIAHFQAAVMRNRERYGSASEGAVGAGR